MHKDKFEVRESKTIGFSRNTATRKINRLVQGKIFERRGKGAGFFFLYRGDNE